MEPKQQDSSETNYEFINFPEFDSFAMSMISIWENGSWRWEKKHGQHVLVLTGEGFSGKQSQVRLSIPYSPLGTSDAESPSSPSSDTT